MKLPTDVAFHQEPRLLVWRPRGVLDEKAVNRIITFIGEQEKASPEPILRFADLAAIDVIDLNFKYIFHVALYRRLTYAGQPTTKSAFLATTADATHIAKLHMMLTDHSALEVAVFADNEAAAKWLGVSGELLGPNFQGAA